MRTERDRDVELFERVAFPYLDSRRGEAVGAFPHLDVLDGQVVNCRADFFLVRF